MAIKLSCKQILPILFNSIRIDDARLRNVYLVAPIHLEFDFQKTVVDDPPI
jgi:hypothetical protein